MELKLTVRRTPYIKDLLRAVTPCDMCFAEVLAKPDMDHLDMLIIMLWLPAVARSWVSFCANVDYLCKAQTVSLDSRDYENVSTILRNNA